MNGPMHGLPPGPKSQAMSITIRDGRTFTICSPGQMNYLRQMAIEQVMAEASERGEEIRDPEQLENLLNQWQEKCPFATLDFVLAKLTPQEQADWAVKYRFQGISSSRPK